MPSVNKAILLGNIGRVETKTFANGDKVVLASLATTERYTKRDGTKAADVTWHNLVVNGKAGDYVEKYITKGDLVYVEGRIRHRAYTSADGSTKTTSEVFVQTIERLTFREAANKAETPAPAPAPAPQIENEEPDLPF